MTSDPIRAQTTPYARAMADLIHDPEAVGRVAERMASEVDADALGHVAAEVSRLLIEFTLGPEFIQFIDEASGLQRDLRAGLYSTDTTREETDR